MAGAMSEYIREVELEENDTMTILHADSDSDISDTELSDVPACILLPTDGPFEATLGADISRQFRKDKLKKPLFPRFNETDASIKDAVKEMRLVASSKRGSKNRSWSATFKFTGRLSKTPAFERFQRCGKSIHAEVADMRLATLALRASRCHARSWAASFSFTKRLSKQPMFPRFARPPGSIADAVYAKRAFAIAKKALMHRSWATSFTLNHKPVKKPKFERFAKPSVSIQVAVEQMRRVVAERRAMKVSHPFVSQLLSDTLSDLCDEECASLSSDCDKLSDMDFDHQSDEFDCPGWVAHIGMHSDPQILGNIYVSADLSDRLGKDVSKLPCFARFARPSASIQAAVQQMRAAKARARLSTHRSWAADFVFTRRSSKTPKFARFAKPIVGIETSVQMMRLMSMVLKSSVLRARAPSCKLANRKSATKFWNLAALSSNLHKTRSRLPSMLDMFQREVSNYASSELLDVEKYLILSASKLDEQTSLTLPTVANADEMALGSFENEGPDNMLDIEVDMLTLTERCTLALCQFENEVARLSAEDEVENLIERELLDEAESLIEKTSQVSWVAGSPANVAKSLRRSKPSMFQMSCDGHDLCDSHARASSLARGYDALGAQIFTLDAKDDGDRMHAPVRSAMEEDLALCPSRRDFAAVGKPIVQKRTRSSSVGSLKKIPLQAIEPLRPLSVSKSSSDLLTQGMSQGGDWSWKLGSAKTSVYSAKNFENFGRHVERSQDRLGSMRRCF
jgi:hypothetical protein